MGGDTSSDSGIENSYKDGDNCNDSNTYDDDGKDDEVISTASGRHKGSSIGDSLTKTTTTNQQQQQNLPPTTTSWSPPPPISFRPEQQQQQQHRVTHGPGGEYKFTYIHIQLI